MKETIVYAYVVADLLHAGHVLALENAKKLAGPDSKLIVGVLTDEATMEKKPRPIISFSERMELIKALRCVDCVVAQDTYSPLKNVLKIKPNVLMESDSHSEEDLRETRKVADSIGCKVQIMPYFPEQSSTNIKERVVRFWKPKNGEIVQPRSSSLDFWKKRAEKYNKLAWVNESSYLEAFVSSADFNKSDIVLDVGTGTGVIAHAIAPLVREVVGLDISQDMLENSNWEGNKYFIRKDIREPFFGEKSFDKVTARMVFHHITEKTQEAMNECYRVLKSGGKIILSEGIPPIPELKEDYSRIFKLKEDRLTFLEKDLVDLMEFAGFKKIKIKVYIMKDFSIKNWLENSGLPEEAQREIFDMHINGSDLFKRAYNMKIVGGDCLIDVKNLILIGEK